MFQVLHLWWYNYLSQSVNWNSMYWVHRPGCANDQVHIISKEAQMTILNANWHISWEFDSKLIVTLGVINEIPKSYEAMTNSAKTGSWFPYAKAISHSETSCGPNSIPQACLCSLASRMKESPQWGTTSLANPCLEHCLAGTSSRSQERSLLGNSITSLSRWEL